MQEEKILYIVRGHQGAGKSTLAEIVTNNSNFVFEADKFPGIYTDAKVYVKEKQSESHKWNLERVENAMQLGLTPIAVSNTSKERWEYQPYLDLAAKYGYTVPIIRCEGVEYPDGSVASSIHNVSEYIVDRTRCKMQPHVQQIENPYPYRGNREDLPENTRTLRIMDRDKTLIFNPLGGIPKYNEMEKVPGVAKKIAEWKQNGDIVVVVSNQGGLEPNYKGIIHKTKDELLIEAKLIHLWFLVDMQVYCPKLDGSEAWVYLVKEENFHQIEKQPYCQGFRKPQAGMIEYAMASYDGRFDDIEMIGDSIEDQLAALAANIPYRHIHEVLYS